MEGFGCELTVSGVPKTVKPGDFIEVKARARAQDPNVTLGLVILAVPATGELLRFAKTGADTFVLTYNVPSFAPRGSYTAMVYATSDSGLRSPAQEFDIQIL